MKKLIFLLVLLTTASYGADYHSPYDPGAARNTLGNVTPATGRAALGLGTMAVATSTDYVATDTFTGHTGATGASVHGLGTISTFASTDYVATSSLAERLDTANASFSEDIDVAGDVGAATVNGVVPLTAAEKTQALVGSSTVNFLAKQITANSASFTGDISQIPRAGYLGGSFVQNVSLADNATATLSCVGAIGGEDGPTGHIYFANTIGGSSGAIFWVQGTNIAEITGTGSWTTTKDTDNKYNVYAEGGYFVLQNMAGANRNFPVVFVGVRK